jgi:hypothetical protein
MKFKSFEISDYKIFKEKSKIEFSDGITKIIGGNGTGKTILFDAMKESFSNPDSNNIKLVKTGNNPLISEFMFRDGEDGFFLGSSPLIFDDAFARMSKDMRDLMIRNFKKFGLQVVILSCFDNFDSDVTYELIYDEKNKESKIVKK